MKGLGIMFEKEPAMIGTTVAAILPVLILFGVNPKIGGAIATAFTVLIGLWIRSQVYSKASVANIVQDTATAVMTAATPQAVGKSGAVTVAGQTIIDEVTKNLSPVEH